MEPPKERQLRWGIAPASLMAEDFATALSVLSPERHCITACMGPYRSQALEFANHFKVPQVFTSFEDLARCSDVDAVYISPLNSMHCELCHLMLNHDKHVLCEQPLCMAEQQVVDLVEKAKARRLFLMEGIWSRCLPAYAALREELQQHTLGIVQEMDCTLGWELPSSQVSTSSPTGVARNYGPDAIQLALWVFKEVPQILRVEGKLNDDGVFVTTDIVMFFKDNRRANLTLSIEEDLPNTAHIFGTNGCVSIENFWCPTSLKFEKKKLDFEPPTAGLKTHFDSRAAMSYELEEVRQRILDGHTESQLFSHGESRLMANLVDQIILMLEADRRELTLQQKQAIC